jgi:hypothetical protein
MPRHTIPDYLLKTAVGLQVEAGISATHLRALINEFAAEQSSYEFGEGFAGFLSVEDIPQGRREDFMSALSALSTLLSQRTRSLTALATAADS